MAKKSGVPSMKNKSMKVAMGGRNTLPKNPRAQSVRGK